MGCSTIYNGPILDWNFTGCDGKPFSNSRMVETLNSALDREDYRFAHDCKLELERRGLDVYGQELKND